MQYTLKAWKEGKVVIDYRTVRNKEKLQGIIKAAFPNCIDLPEGMADIYWSTGREWDCNTIEVLPNVPRCTVDEILTPKR